MAKVRKATREKEKKKKRKKKKKKEKEKVDPSFLKYLPSSSFAVELWTSIQCVSLGYPTFVICLSQNIISRRCKDFKLKTQPV